MNNLSRNILNRNNQKGFTLIELMVSISIFMSVMMIAMGSLLIASNAAKEAKALRITMDNVNFAMENMTRSIRMGDHYYCISSNSTPYSDGSALPQANNTSPHDCTMSGSTGGLGIVFSPAEVPNSRFAYQKYTRTNATGGLQKCTSTGCVDIISPEVDIKKLQFFVNGTYYSDTDLAPSAPNVYIIMSGEVKVKGKVTTFSVQTMAAQRSNED